ncbi:Transcriptional activator of fatty acid utilization [Borealophlyctis nickersoniae]|nr:Transcriptional activator of fatty acid utilization [Borealophlyctis nickersoniae]
MAVETLLSGLVAGASPKDTVTYAEPRRSSLGSPADSANDDSSSDDDDGFAEGTDSDAGGFKGIALAIHRPRRQGASSPVAVDGAPTFSQVQWQTGVTVTDPETGVLVQSVALEEDSVVAHRINNGNGGITIVEDLVTDTVLFYGSTSTSNTTAWRQSPRFSDGIMSIALSSDAMPVNTAPSDSPPCSPELLHHLVSLYFQHIHPYLPMINRMRFLRQLKEKKTEHTRSLANWGIANPQALHESFFAQARVLLGKQFDWPHINNVQALLLLTLVGMGTNQNASSYHYIGIAHRQAVELGMHRNLDNVRNLDETMKETMRSTWFCLYILDRYVGVVEGRPLAIDDEDWDTPLPREEEDGEVDRMIRHVALCSILGRIANHVNRPSRPNRPSKHDVAKEIDVELGRWHALLPPELQAKPDPRGRWSFHHHLHVMYHTTLILLHRLATGKFNAVCHTSALAIKATLEALPDNFRNSNAMGGRAAEVPFVFVMPVVVYAGLTASTLFLDMVLEAFGPPKDAEGGKGGAGAKKKPSKRAKLSLESGYIAAVDDLRNSLQVFDKMKDTAMFSVYYGQLILEGMRSVGLPLDKFGAQKAVSAAAAAANAPTTAAWEAATMKHPPDMVSSPAETGDGSEAMSTPGAESDGGYTDDNGAGHLSSPMDSTSPHPHSRDPTSQMSHPPLPSHPNPVSSPLDFDTLSFTESLLQATNPTPYGPPGGLGGGAGNTGNGPFADSIFSELLNPFFDPAAVWSNIGQNADGAGGGPPGPAGSPGGQGNPYM